VGKLYSLIDSAAKSNQPKPIGLKRKNIFFSYFTNKTQFVIIIVKIITIGLEAK